MWQMNNGRYNCGVAGKDRLTSKSLEALKDWATDQLHPDCSLQRLVVSSMPTCRSFARQVSLWKPLDSMKVDIWAAGLCFYFMVKGHVPFNIGERSTLQVGYANILDQEASCAVFGEASKIFSVSWQLPTQVTALRIVMD
eukprot:3771995-Amphidinium_carterae.1